MPTPDQPSDLELVITCSKTLEALLEHRFGAAGRGLHEKTGSVESRLPAGIVRKLRFMATVRNKLVHEMATERLESRRSFLQTFEATRDFLASGKPPTLAPPVRNYEAPDLPLQSGKRENPKRPTRPRSPGHSLGSRVTYAWRYLFTDEMSRARRPLAILGSLMGALGAYWLSARPGTPLPLSLLAAAAGALVGYYWLQVALLLLFGRGVYWLYELAAA